MKKFIALSSWNCKVIGFILVACTAFMVACGDDSSSSIGPNDEPVSEERSSSSKKLSSSSVILSASKESSSSSAKSSSSSASLPNCSALLEGETGWSWDVPKECRFNPNIDYGTMTDERDGKVYRTVKIGDQVWMAENLNFDPGQGGSGENAYEWSWCYDNEPKNCDVVGRYYTWAAAIDSVKLANDVDNPQDCGYYGKNCGLLGREQGVCPMGWHLPSGAEIEILLTVVGVQDKEKYWQWQGAGIKLKSISGWKDDDSESGNGTDSFGFSALPTGDGHNDGSYHDDGEKANFWSSTETTSGSAYGMYMNNNYDVAKLDYGDKRYGFSVRCVKN